MSHACLAWRLGTFSCARINVSLASLDHVYHTSLMPLCFDAFCPATVLPAAEYGQPRVIDPVSMASFLRIALEDAPTAKGSALNANLEAADLMLRVSEA